MQSSKTKLHTYRAREAPDTMIYRQNWRFGALAGAAVLLGSLASLEAHALALGRVTVQSALGEALRAEIEVAEINAEEASSLRVGIASSDAFKAAGLEYSATVVGVQISLQKRADGRSFLRLSSPRAVTEPFVDLVVEANWSSGRVVRDYTLLFDPPNLKQATGPNTAPSIRSNQSAPNAPAARPVAPFDAAPPAQNVRPVPMARAPRPAAAAPQRQSASGQQVVVRAGDTASKIAGQNKPAGISLDQMLLALLNTNPQAFIGGNINRLKSGAVLEIPSEQTAAATPSGQASQTIVAQARDFNNFRRKLAEGAPAAQVASADRQAGGKLQAKVDDSAASVKPPDKLTLSKGAVQGKTAAEEKIAKDRQALSESTRIAELSKNISDLDKLKGVPAATGATGATGSTGAAKGPGVVIQAPTVAPSLPNAATPPLLAASTAATAASTARPAGSAPAVVVAPVATAPVVAAPQAVASASAPVATQASTPATTPVSTSVTSAVVGTSTTTTTVITTTATTTTATAAVVPAAAALIASAAAPAAAPKAVVAPPAPLPAPSLIDDLIGNDFTLPALAALLALLAGFVFYRNKKKNNPAAVDSSFLESRLQPDSFFGASGGQRVDTSESSASGSSLVYSPSQLDAAGDVDPVAEADVYLAYGRDLQAEEILKEALRTTPARVAVHAKLAEIYAKRRDVKGLESIASAAFNLTNGSGAEWNYIAELGRELEPDNDLYKPGGQPVSMQLPAAAGSAALAASFGSDTMPVPHPVSPVEAAAVSGDVDFDLDLDLLSDEVAAARVEPTISMNIGPSAAFDSAGMDFNDLKLNTQPIAIKPNAVQAPDTNYAATQPVVAIKAPGVAALPAAEPDSGMLEFDMSSLSLDLDEPVKANASVAQSAPYAAEGPLETKFALAEEFRALGDPDGARSLANEVVADAQGALKTKAQAFLNSLM